MSNLRLLIALAHPDDESFGAGGLIRKYVDAGVEVYYIVSTNGAAGSIQQKYIDEHGSKAAVRYHEIDCAAEVLGFTEVIKLDYDDSGMAGTPQNQNPACLIQADEDVVTQQIVAVIRRVQPQVILTFDPFGAYGHPDHIYMHRVTTRAFHAAANATQFPDAGPVYAPQKLYYMTFPKVLLGLRIVQSLLQGKNPRKLGVNRDMDMVEIWEKAIAPNMFVDVADYFEAWDAASACHRSQANPRPQMKPWLRRLLLGKQGLKRVIPPMRGRSRRERDLFDGVQA